MNGEAYHAAFGERLKQLRKAAGLSRTNVAEQIGVGEPTVNAWELGRSTPNVKHHPALAKTFGLPNVRDLYPGGGPPLSLTGVLSKIPRNALRSLAKSLKVPVHRTKSTLVDNIAKWLTS